MKVIYISGPLSTGDLIENMRAAVDIANVVVACGGAPYVPHLQSVTWQMFAGNRMGGIKDYSVWLPIDFEFIRRADALYRIPGYSYGSDRETEYAAEHKIPMFTTVEALRDFLRGTNANNQ